MIIEAITDFAIVVALFFYGDSWQYYAVSLPITTKALQVMSTFLFQPRWKEELVCTGSGGSFVLELPMGVLSVYLPTEEVWRMAAPDWSRELWPILRVELEAWCVTNKAKFVIDKTASIL